MRAASNAAIDIAGDVQKRLDLNESPGIALSGWRGWLGQSAWAVIDRGLFSLSNFAINVVLARWLPPHDYGAFTLAYAVFLLLGAAHTSFLSDPMLVFGAGTYRERWPGYVRVLLRAHWAFSAAAALGLMIAALVLLLAGQTQLAAALAALAVAIPFILLQWLLRLTCYVRMEPQRAARAGGSYMFLVLAGIYLIERVGRLSPLSSLGLMGVASLASVSGIYRELRKLSPKVSDRDLFHDVVGRHWHYCRWIIGANALAWIPQSACYLLLPIRGGLASAGALKALVNVIMPLLQTYWALAGVLVPRLVQAPGRKAFGQIVRVALGVWVTGAVIYWLLLGAFHVQAMHWLYNGRYDNDAHLLWIVGLLPILFAAELLLNSVLRSREQPRQIFWASVLSSVSALTVGVALIFTWGVRGAVLGLLCSSITSVVAMGVQCRKHADDWQAA